VKRADYKRLRSAAREALRRADLFDEQASFNANGDMSERNRKVTASLSQLAADTAARIPGGLTRRRLYQGNCLLLEWQPRRHRVYLAIHTRHIAERTQVRALEMAA